MHSGPAARFAVFSVVALLALPLLSTAPARAEAPTTQRAAFSSFPVGDPDTVRAEDGRYVTYGTSVPRGRGERCSRDARGTLHVPVLVHGSGNRVGMTDCASGDALPSGPGSWADRSKAIWAPGVVRFRDRYFMYYTATRRGSGRHCLGLAVGRSAYGPFVNRGGFACPSQRWAIDANPVVFRGSLYVAYRDDAVTTGRETAISVVRADRNGRAVPGTRRTLLTSTDITWDTKGNKPDRSHVVENPSLFQVRGRWFLAFSGNRWATSRYATGLADCGRTPVPARRCRPLQGTARPYFGFRGPGGLGPVRGLPGNHRGPGAMDVYRAADGSLRVTWHWFDGELRHPVTGRLTRDRSGFHVR